MIHYLETFVDVGPLFDLLSSDDHQIIFGRRGTGKTHALNYLSDTRTREGDIAVYVDLSNMGSSAGLYADQELPLAERATRLLIDALLTVHDTLLEFFIAYDENFDLSQAGPILDDFLAAVLRVRVAGNTQVEDSFTEQRGRDDASTTSASVGLQDTKIELGAETRSSRHDEHGRAVSRSGVERHAVHFGSVRHSLDRVAQIVRPKKVWLLLDEWSSVPIDLQPFLADLIRRSVFPVRSVVTKIAAIEQRSQFILPGPQGSYLGIEVGADAAADINLDDFMVFDNDASRARTFYRSLFFKHIAATDVVQESSIPLDSEEALIRLAFTQLPTFDELVRASEGVPRDAINIAMQAAQSAGTEAISIEHLRRGAHAWYQRDKETTIHASESAKRLLYWIINEVIGLRQARAFLLQSDSTDPLIETLFDARVLHILKRNISTHDEPGIRYNVYKLDYGCYVDLMRSTKAAPLGLLQLDESGEREQAQYVDVPPDDYRAIRRAVLRLEKFYQDHAGN